MAKNNSVDNLGATVHDLQNVPNSQCRSCLLGKATRSPFPSAVKPTQPLERLHSDLCGPLVEGIDGQRFWIVVRDATSGYTFVAALKTKDQASRCIQQVIAMFERQTGLLVKAVRTDNGG
eukprot:50921-Chlamydomonas_euryale.AAC.1